MIISKLENTTENVMQPFYNDFNSTSFISFMMYNDCNQLYEFVSTDAQNFELFMTI